MKFFLPKIRDVLFIAVLFGVILFGQRSLNIDGDLGRHLTIGNYILVQRSIPTQDLFSNSMPGQPLTPHEWLAEVIYAVFFRLLNLSGVVLLEGLLIGFSTAWIFADACHRGKSYFIAGVFTIWAIAMSSMHWLPRPHLFTFLFLAVWTTGIKRTSKGDKFPIWFLPMLMLFWVNSHGAYISGFVVWGCYLIGSIAEIALSGGKYSIKHIKPLIIVGVASLAVTLINPAGWRLWQTSLGYINNAYLTSHTLEYLSPDFHITGFLPFLGMIAFIIFSFSRSVNKLSIADGLLLSLWIAMGLYSARNIELFAIISAPILAGYFSASVKNSNLIQAFDNTIHATDNKLTGITWPIAAVLIIVVIFNLNHGGNTNGKVGNYQFDSLVFPVAAVDWVKNHPQQGNMFNYFTWGGYLLYRLWPDQKVFIDGQTDFYGESLTREYEKVISLSPGWDQTLTKYNIKWIIFPTRSGLVDGITGIPDWSIVYSDNNATIAVRNPVSK